jgi:anti-anti-sigma factor
MAVKKQVSEKEVSIIIEDRFDFSLHQQFRDAYMSHIKANTAFIIDLAKAEYMDSSALGMILLLKDHAEKNSSTVTIRKPNEFVYKILQIAQFHRLLPIEL